MREITFPADAPQIGGLASHDYFGDGSFLLLDAPGVRLFPCLCIICPVLRPCSQHCTGHMLGLARVTASPKPAYVLLAGDTVHHPALLRPSPFLPLPAARHTSLPAALKDVGAPAYDRPFLDHPTTKWCAHEDMDVAKRTAACVQAFDAHPDVLVLLAHDGSLGGVIETFPSSVDGWKEKGWKEPAAWAFLEPGNAVNRWQE